MTRPRLALEAAQRGEGPPDGGYTRAEWDAMWRGSILASREAQDRARADAERLGVGDE